MSDVIVIRIYPKTPVDPTTFEKALEGLTITVYELSVTDPKGTKSSQIIRTAKYDPSDPSATIFQHFGPSGFASIATAAVDATAFEPPGYKEYPTPASGGTFADGSDIRLSITRAVKVGSATVTQTIVDTSLNYNVPLERGVTLPGDATTFALFTNIALYLPIPVADVGLDPDRGFVTVPTDGSPPNYADLLKAVRKVLDGDPGVGAYDPTWLLIFDPSHPGDLTKAQSLTVAQCRHIAYEIYWNRVLNPLPEAKLSDLESWYTNSDPTHSSSDRQQFEAHLTTYYTTSNTQADTLTKFVFALSAALVCQKLTDDAKNAGLAIPILPGSSGALGKADEANVILSS